MPVTMRVSPWFALGVAAVAAVLTGGNWNVPVAAWFGPRVGGCAATLVFPLAMTATELAVAAISPYGVWGSLAHTQFGNLPLMQSASVIGTWGVTFLICWFNSTLAWAWRLGFSPERAGKGALICLAVLTAVFAAAAARLALTVH